MNQELKKRSGPITGRYKKRFHSLLVPVDLTPSSDRVLGRVSLLPLAEDARITLLHVISKGLPIESQRKVHRNAKSLLTEEAKHLRKSLARTIRIETLVKVGAPVKEIVASAKTVKAELIVMGRTGGSILGDLFLGSTAERVIRQGRLPVLVVRLAPRAAYKRPAIALDFDEVAQGALRLILSMHQGPYPAVKIIHVFDNPYPRSMYPSLSTNQLEQMKEEYKVRARRELAKLLPTEFARLPTEEAPRWEFHILYGSPHIVIEKAAKKANTDLLVLGTHAISGLKLMFIGTVAGDILRNVTCDVLVVPPRPAGRR